MIRAITIRQPYAWAVMRGFKSVENRVRPGTWRPAVGERVAVHAAKAWSKPGGFDPLVTDAYTSEWPQPGTCPFSAAFPRGVILGTVRVSGVHLADECRRPDGSLCSPWAHPNQHDGRPMGHLVLDEPFELPEPIVCRGQQGLWRVLNDRIHALLDDQLVGVR